LFGFQHAGRRSDNSIVEEGPARSEAIMNRRCITTLFLALLMLLVAHSATATTKIQQSGRPKPTAKAKQTALLNAISNGDTATVKALIAAGVDVNSRDKDGNTALMLAACGLWAGKEREIVKALLAARAEVEARNPYGGTALIVAAGCGSGGNEALRLLLDAGAQVDARDKVGRTALFDADASGSNEAVQALINAGADVNARDETGRTPLMGAADQGQEGHLRALLAAGADVNAKDNHGVTALMVAENSELAKNSAIIQLLKAAGAVEPANALPLCQINGEALVAVSVPSDNEVYVCKKRVARQEIAREVDKLLRELPEEKRIAYIKAAPQVIYGTIVGIIDDLGGLGYDRIGLLAGKTQGKPKTTISSRRGTGLSKKDAGERSSEQTTGAREDLLVVTVEALTGGKIFATVGGVRVPLRELASKVSALLKDRANKSVKIVAPATMHYGSILEVIDLVKAGGAETVGFGVKSQ
jgi:ankyrin repeat protein